MKKAGAQLFPTAKGGCHLKDRVFRDYFPPVLNAVAARVCEYMI